MTTSHQHFDRHAPLSVHGSVYVLELEGGRIYVGWSRNVSNRLSEHWAGVGSQMTRMYPPIRVLQLVFPADHDIENDLTRQYARTHGWQTSSCSPNVEVIGVPFRLRTRPEKNNRRPRTQPCSVNKPYGMTEVSSLRTDIRSYSSSGRATTTTPARR